MELPEWRDQNFPNLFLEGLRALLILLAYVGVPLFAGWLLSEIVELLTFDLLGIVSHFPLAFAGFVAPFLFLSGIHSYLSDGLFSDAWQIHYRHYKFQTVLAAACHSGYCILGNFSSGYPPLRFILLPWIMGTACVFHSLAIFRLIDYFDSLRKTFLSSHANLRLSMPSLWPYLGIVSVDERQPGKILPKM